MCDVDEEEEAQTDRLSRPVFFGNHKLDRSTVQLGALVTVDANALRARGAKILGGGVIGISAEVADEFVASGSEHHEGVDVGTASATTRRSGLAKIQDRDFGFTSLERRERL